MKISRSLVARGCAWNETAYPPTTRYLTLWALKRDKSSLKSWNIQGRFLQSVSCKSDFGNRAHAFMGGPTLPVAIFVSLHLFATGVNADRLVHAVFVARDHPICSGYCVRDINVELFKGVAEPRPAGSDTTSAIVLRSDSASCRSRLGFRTFPTCFPLLCRGPPSK